LQFRDPDHAASVAATKPAADPQADFLRFHGVAAAEFEAGPGELTEVFGKSGFAWEAWKARSAWP